MQYTSPAISKLGAEGFSQDHAEIMGVWFLTETVVAAIGVVAGVAAAVTIFVLFAIDITP